MTTRKGTIGILAGGGDVPGLNAAIKAVVNRAAEHGHEVIGLRRGWAGLLYVNPDDPASLADPVPVHLAFRGGNQARTEQGSVQVVEHQLSPAANHPREFAQERLVCRLRPEVPRT